MDSIRLARVQMLIDLVTAVRRVLEFGDFLLYFE